MYETKQGMDGKSNPFLMDNRTLPKSDFTELCKLINGGVKSFGQLLHISEKLSSML